MVDNQVLEACIQPVLDKAQIDLVEVSSRVQAKQLFICVLADTLKGITLEQCSKANRLIIEAIDDAQIIDMPYSVEVSSPGLDRPFKIPRDYERAVGETIEVSYFDADTKMQKLEGVLLAFQDEVIIVKAAKAKESTTLDLSIIHEAKKAFKW